MPLDEKCASAVACCRRGYIEEKDLVDGFIHCCERRRRGCIVDLVMYLAEGA